MIIKKLINDSLNSFRSSEFKKDNKLAHKNIPKVFDRFRDELLSNDVLFQVEGQLLHMNFG